MRAARTAASNTASAVISVPQLKILNAVVGLVAVDVMDRFVILKPTAKMLGHHHAMLRVIAQLLAARRTLRRWHIDVRIPRLVDVPALASKLASNRSLVRLWSLAVATLRQRIAALG